jgi:hypothetical protein
MVCSCSVWYVVVVYDMGATQDEDRFAPSVLTVFVLCCSWFPLLFCLSSSCVVLDCPFCFVCPRPVSFLICPFCFVCLRPVSFLICRFCFVCLRPVSFFICSFCFVCLRPVSFLICPILFILYCCELMIKTMRYMLQYRLTRMRVYWW